MNRFALGLLLAVCLFIVRILYFISYPFIISGDGNGYYHDMLLPFKSSLVHASGYPFLSYYNVIISKMFGLNPARVMMYSQQLIFIVVLVFMFLALTRIIPEIYSFFCCLFLGIDFNLLSATGTTRPEFFQSILLIAFISFFILAFTSSKRTDKMVLYAVSGFVFAAGLLTKFNFLPTVLLFLLILIDAQLSLRDRIKSLIFSLTCAFIFLFLFLLTYHYPSTKTFRLTMDKGWVFMEKLFMAGISIDANDGPASKKYIILTGDLPVEKACCGNLYSSLDYVADDIRKPYRDKYLDLIFSNDINRLDKEVERRNRALGDHKSFQKIYYYIGLEEGEKVTTQVFFESVLNNPKRYVVNVFNSFVQSLDFYGSYNPYAPIFETTNPFIPKLYSSRHNCSVIKLNDERVDLQTAGQRDAIKKILDICDPHAKTFGGGIWRAGPYVLYFLSWPQLIPPIIFWVLSFLNLIAIAFTFLSQKVIEFQHLFFSFCVLILLGLMLFSSIVFTFRVKELILAQPLVNIIMAISIKNLSSHIINVWKASIPYSYSLKRR